MNIPCFLTYQELTAFVQNLNLPMLINVRLQGYQVEHVVGIAPYKSSATHNVEYHLIDGAHPQRQPMEYSHQNLNWCFDGLEKIISGFCFVPLAARSFKIVKSIGLKSREENPVCLYNVPGIPVDYAVRNVVTKDVSGFIACSKSLVAMFRQRKLVNNV